MFKYLSNLSIQLKFIFAGGLGLISLIIILVTNIITTNKLRNYNGASLSISQVEVRMLMLRRNEKDFLARRELKYKEKYNKNYAKLEIEMKQLRNSLLKINIDTKEINNSLDDFVLYKNDFNSLVIKQLELGLNEKQGLQGKLRTAVHDAESKIKHINNQQLRADMLQLRRNEKDFLLRLNLKYRSRFDNNFRIFLNNFAKASINSSLKSDIKSSMLTYKKMFSNYVTLREEIGLNSKQGLLGEMRITVHKAEEVLNKLTVKLRTVLKNDVGNIDRYLMIIDIIAGSLGLLVAFIFWLLSISIIKPLKHLSHTMSEVATNNDLTLRADILNQDEIGHTGNSFNQMLSKFQNIIDQVNDSSVHIATSSEEMTAVMAQNNQGRLEQKELTTQLSISMTELATSMSSIAKDALSAAGVASKTMEDSSQGGEVVDIATKTINILSSDITKAANAINIVEEDSERIGSVVEVIKGIAEQTNLLALNAAIEAARAGEQGRGFAVVADEVRTLAGRTQAATKEINGMIESLQSGSTHAVELMGKSKNKTEEGVERTEEASQSFRDIVKSIQEINEMSKIIANTSNDQSVVTNQVNGNAEDINRIMTEATEASEQINIASNDLSTQAHSLQAIVQQFKI